MLDTGSFVLVYLSFVMWHDGPQRSEHMVAW